MRALLTLLATLLSAISLPTAAFAAEAAPPPRAENPPAEWGTVLGRITFDGDEAPLRVVPMRARAAPPGNPAGVPVPTYLVEDSLQVGENRGLANAYVYLRSKPTRVHPAEEKMPARKIELAAGLLRLEPHALFARRGDTLVMKNVGREPLNIKMHGNSEFNMVVPLDNNREWTLQGANSIPQPLDSNVMPWMRGWLLVRDDSYGSITNERGLFVITNLPLREPLDLQLWHERAGYLRNITSTTGQKTSAVGQIKITLTEAVTDLGEFRIPVELFRE